MTTSPRLFDYDPETGVRIDFIGSEDGKDAYLRYHQDCEAILDLNKAKQSAGREYYAKDPDMWKVASIPITVQMKWLTEHGVDVMNPDHIDGVKRLLNDPEWRYLKTADIII